MGRHDEYAHRDDYRAQELQVLLRCGHRENFAISFAAACSLGGEPIAGNLVGAGACGRSRAAIVWSIGERMTGPVARNSLGLARFIALTVPEPAVGHHRAIEPPTL